MGENIIHHYQGAQLLEKWLFVYIFICGQSISNGHLSLCLGKSKVYGNGSPVSAGAYVMISQVAELTPSWFTHASHFLSAPVNCPAECF